MTEPARPNLLRLAAVLSWITPLGVTKDEFDKLVEAGTITRIVLHPGGRGYYAREQVRAVIVEPLAAVERRFITTTNHTPHHA